MVKEASKLTLGQPTTVYMPCQVEAVLETKRDRWMTGGRIPQYQALLLDTPVIRLRVCQTLNPASLMPDPPTFPLDHQCMEIIDEGYTLLIQTYQRHLYLTQRKHGTQMAVKRFALTRALELGEGKRINVHLDSLVYFPHPASPCSNLEGKRDSECLKLSY